MNPDPAESPAGEYERQLGERGRAAMAENLVWVLPFLATQVASMLAVAAALLVGHGALVLVLLFWLASGALAGIATVPVVRGWPALSSQDRFVGLTPAGVALSESALFGLYATLAVVS